MAAAATVLVAVFLALGVVLAAQHFAGAWRYASDRNKEIALIRAEASRYEWEIRGGLIRPEPEEEPEPEEDEQYLEAWLADNVADDNLADDIRGMYAVVSGRRKRSPAKVDEYRERLLKLGAPCP